MDTQPRRIRAADVPHIPVTVPGSTGYELVNGELVAVMPATRTPSWVAGEVFGTLDPRHTLVAEMSRWGRRFVSGPMRVLRLPVHHDFRDLRLTPAERNDSLYRTPLFLLVEGPAAKFQIRLRDEEAHHLVTRRLPALMDAERGLPIDVPGPLRPHLADTPFHQEMQTAIGQFAGFADYARRHRDVIARFGEALGATHDSDQLMRLIVEAAIEATNASGGILVGTSGELVKAGNPDKGAERIEVRQAAHIGAPIETAQIRLCRLHLMKDVLERAGELADIGIRAGPGFVVRPDAQTVHQVVARADPQDQVALIEGRAAADSRHKVHAAAAERSRRAYIRRSGSRRGHRQAHRGQRYRVHDLIFA